MWLQCNDTEVMHIVIYDLNVTVPAVVNSVIWKSLIDWNSVQLYLKVAKKIKSLIVKI